MRIALVHDWFNEVGGAEKVVKEILYCYPDADVYCLFDFFDDTKRQRFLSGKSTTKSFIQKIPFAKKFYRFLFPLFPGAIEKLDLSDYDLIISSSYCVAKGIKKHPGQLHICYCHSPVRYAWDLKDDYLKETKDPLSRSIFSFFLNRLKNWDRSVNDRVDFFIANSHNVSNRIKQNYNRESTVIYPPVDVEQFSIQQQKQEYYFTVSRLVAYKKMELLVKAFAQFPDLKLMIAGDGPNRKKLKKMAPPNVQILGYLELNELREKIRSAKAFVAAANEDFGITIVEAQACGTPVIVPYLGGYKETVLSTTGLFFEEQSVVSIVKAISTFEKQNMKYETADFLKNVQPFNVNRFHTELRAFINQKYTAHAERKL
ncbi:MAG: putative alpha-glycosyltransferase [Bacteroidetes bacterium]|nr:putative alpha-glycosyltransferase [Bacteroidota bacterium]